MIDIPNFVTFVSFVVNNHIDRGTFATPRNKD